MSDINKEIADYITDVKKCLICNRKRKKTIVCDFRKSVLDYTEENSITDIKDIYTQFGTPQEIAQIYLPEPDIQTIKRKIILKRIIIAVLVCILGYLVFFLTGIGIDYYLNRGNFVTYQIITPIEYSTEDCSFNQQYGE